MALMGQPYARTHAYELPLSLSFFLLSVGVTAPPEVVTPWERYDETIPWECYDPSSLGMSL